MYFPSPLLVNIQRPKPPTQVTLNSIHTEILLIKMWTVANFIWEFSIQKQAGDHTLEYWSINNSSLTRFLENWIQVGTGVGLQTKLIPASGTKSEARSKWKKKKKVARFLKDCCVQPLHSSQHTVNVYGYLFKTMWVWFWWTSTIWSSTIMVS